MFGQDVSCNWWKAAVALAAVWVVTGSRAWAADTFSFSESQKDVLTCSNKTSESCETFTSGKFTTKALFFSGQTNVLVQLSVNDDIDVVIGGFEFEDVISNGKLGKGTATFNLTDVDCSKTPCKTNIHGRVTFKVSAKGFEVDVSTKTGATANETFEDSVIANDHATDNSTFNDTIDVSISVNSGAFVDSFTAGVSGTATTKASTKNGGSFNLNSVKVKGTGLAL